MTKNQYQIETVVPKSTLMYHVARGEMREVFRHEELGAFDVTAMRELARTKGERVTIALDQVAPFVQAKHVYDQQRVADLKPESFLHDPILYVRLEEGPPSGTSYLLIDGSHRVMRRHAHGMSEVDAYILTEADIIRPSYSKYGDTQQVLGLDWDAPLESLKKGKAK